LNIKYRAGGAFDVNETLLIVLVILVALLLAGVVALLMRRPGGETTDARLATLEATQQTASQALDQRILNQERAINEQLGKVGERVGQSLQQSTEKTQATLKALGERLAVMDKAQEHITQLSTQMVGLQDILSNKQARGAFGEVQLNDLVTGILPPRTFDFQHTLSNGKRADCMIQLPNPPGPICIDSKFPLESFQRLAAAGSDEAARVTATRQFDQDVRKHLKDIAERYILPGETGEGALMFVPSEAVYAEIHAHLPGAVEESRRLRVYLVSPTTLWALLNTMRAIFRDVEMHQQAEVMQKEVRLLLGDIGRLDKRVGQLGSHFGQVTKDIEQIQISTKAITRHGERIDELEFEDGDAEEAGPEQLVAPRPANDGA
jgi:DNA recombination protein RmuC